MLKAERKWIDWMIRQKNILLFLGDVNLSLDFSYEIYAKLAEQFTGLDNPLIVDYKWAKEVLGGRQDA